MNTENSKASRPLKIFFYMWDFVGPQNACIGLGQALLRRGHQVVFVVNESFGDKFTKYGFEQRFVKEDPARVAKKADVDPIAEFCTEMEHSGFFENVSPAEKLKSYQKINFFEDIYLKNRDFEPQLKELLAAEKPDFLVVDSDIVAPCLIHSDIPWCYLFCSAPLGFFNSPDLPPFTSGLPTNGDRVQWAEFRKIQQEYHFGEVVKFQRMLCDQFGYPFDEKLEFVSRSPYLNIYQYPEELDYHKEIRIPDTFLRVDAFCREEAEGEFVLPPELKTKMKPGDKLIYLSMGSMGSVDLKLMNRLVSILAKTPHFYIVSRGYLADQYALADNMWGEAYLPQTSILPLVDLFITHGGNNSVTESMKNGKPMIVLPLFYDQYDNAQRLQETGYGIRLDTYGFQDQELVDAIEKLLHDEELSARLRKASERIQAEDSKLKACLAIEGVWQKVTNSDGK